MPLLPQKGRKLQPLFPSPQPGTVGHSDSMVLIKDQMYFQTLGIPSVPGSVIHCDVCWNFFLVFFGSLIQIFDCCKLVSLPRDLVLKDKRKTPFKSTALSV